MTLTLQFLPYDEIESLDTGERIGKILGIVKNKSVVLMEGRLKPEEETKLIKKTMEDINKNFKGIELCTIFPEEKNVDLFKKLKKNLLACSWVTEKELQL